MGLYPFPHAHFPYSFPLTSRLIPHPLHADVAFKITTQTYLAPAYTSVELNTFLGRIYLIFILYNNRFVAKRSLIGRQWPPTYMQINIT